MGDTPPPAYPWLHPVPWFLAQFGMPTNVTYGEGADYTYLSARTPTTGGAPRANRRGTGSV